MPELDRKQIGKALGRIPQSLFIMTSFHEDRTRGVMVSWVQQVGFEPPMVMACLSKGRPIIPLLHDSHSFALCQIDPADKLTIKRFGGDVGDNPFETIDVFRGATGSPILKKSLAYLDCELVRHFDVDGDHDIYVGLVRGGNVMVEGDPIVRLRADGFTY